MMNVTPEQCAQAQVDVGLSTQRMYVDLPVVDEKTEMVIFIHRRDKLTKKIRHKRKGDPIGAQPYLPGLN